MLQQLGFQFQCSSLRSKLPLQSIVNPSRRWCGDCHPSLSRTRITITLHRMTLPSATSIIFNQCQNTSFHSVSSRCLSDGGDVRTICGLRSEKVQLMMELSPKINDVL
ncbi:hypothetical protein HanPI659440_Chr11g0404061 [Helianthus annuus]|nr:hypothetical protein HanPI659440_Chr11g0404061 [Helianthus annuus]